MPYRVAVYNFQDTGHQENAHAQMDAMEADGWELRDTALNFAEGTFLWHKPAVKAEDKPEEKPPADEGKHAAKPKAGTRSRASSSSS